MKIRRVRPSSPSEGLFCVFLTSTWKTFATLSPRAWPSRATGYFSSGQTAKGKRTFLRRLGCLRTCVPFANPERMDSSGKNAINAECFSVFRTGKARTGRFCFLFDQKGKKSLFLDGEKLSKLGDFLGEFPSVALSSRDFRLVREGPSERRKWLDLLLSTASTEYFQSLQLYHRALRERNALLKKGGGDRELDAFEQALIPSGLRIQKMRVDALPKISVLLSESYAALSSKKEEADLAYKLDLLLESEQEWAKRLVEERAKDRIMGNTRRGPHRDDFTFSLQWQGCPNLCLRRSAAWLGVGSAVCGIFLCPASPQSNSAYSCRRRPW